MAASAILTTHGTETALTLTATSLADGSGRSSLFVNNLVIRAPAALITCEVELTGTSVADKFVEVYLLRDIGVTSDDAWGGTDAAITIVNANRLGTMRNPSAAANVLRRTFTTEFSGELGPKWGIAIVNGTGAALGATAGNHKFNYRTLIKENQ